MELFCKNDLWRLSFLWIVATLYLCHERGWVSRNTENKISPFSTDFSKFEDTFSPCLQHTATHCNSGTRPNIALQGIHFIDTVVQSCKYFTLQHTATHCITLSHTVIRGLDLTLHSEAHTSSTRWWSLVNASRCNTLQITATHCNTL